MSASAPRWLSEEERFRRFRHLPEALQDFLFDDVSAERRSECLERAGVEGEGYDDKVSGLLMHVFLGGFPPTELQERVESVLDVEESSARELTRCLEREFLDPFRTTVDEVWSVGPETYFAPEEPTAWNDDLEAHFDAGLQAAQSGDWQTAIDELIVVERTDVYDHAKREFWTRVLLGNAYSQKAEALHDGREELVASAGFKNGHMLREMAIDREREDPDLRELAEEETRSLVLSTQDWSSVVRASRIHERRGQDPAVDFLDEQAVWERELRSKYGHEAPLVGGIYVLLGRYRRNEDPDAADEFFRLAAASEARTDDEWQERCRSRAQGLLGAGATGDSWKFWS